MTTSCGTEPAFRSHLHTLRRRWRWVAALIVLGLSAGIAHSLTTRPLYSATAQLLVQSSTDVTGQQQPATPTDVLTELQLISSAQVRSSVRRQLGWIPAVSADEVGQTNVVTITATSAMPTQAAHIANAYAHAFLEYRQAADSRKLAAAENEMQARIGSLQHQLASMHGAARSGPGASALLNQEAIYKEELAQMQVSGAASAGGVQVIAPAPVPTSPSSPNRVHDSLLGLAAGLLLGVAAAFGRESLDDRISSREAAEEAAGIPVLATIPPITSCRRHRPAVISIAKPMSPAAESYRSLRTSLQFARHERELRTVQVTSAAAGDGKTSALINLGAVFAQNGERVLLASCDLRRPGLARLLRLAQQPGLTDVVLGRLALNDALVPVPDVGRLWVLPPGTIPPNPAELLGSPRVGEIIRTLADSFDLVLIDTPPVPPVTDAVVMSQHVDGTLMVVAAGQTRRPDLRRAAEKLERAHATILGSVLNRLKEGTGYSYRHRSYRARKSEMVSASAPEHGASQTGARSDLRIHDAGIGPAAADAANNVADPALTANGDSRLRIRNSWG